MLVNNVKKIYIIASVIITIGILFFCSLISINTLKQNYINIFVSGYNFSGEDLVRQIEYAVKYGKPINNFYSMNTILRDVKSGMENISRIDILLPDGRILYSTEDNTSENSPFSPALIAQIAVSENNYTLHNNYYHVMLPLKNSSGVNIAFLDMVFEEKIIADKISYFMRIFSLITIVLVIISAVLVISSMMLARFVDSEGRIYKFKLLLILTFVFTLTQIIFTGVNIITFRMITSGALIKNTEYVSEILKNNIETVSNKGIRFSEMTTLETWLESISDSIEGIDGIAVISEYSNKVITATRNVVNIELKNSFNESITLSLSLSSSYINKDLPLIIGVAVVTWLSALLILIIISLIVFMLIDKKLVSDLKKYNEELERIVAERTAELKKSYKLLESEKLKSEKLLLNILPVRVAKNLRNNGRTEPEEFENVTVYFSDIVGFTNISNSLTPKVLIDELNEIFTAFDNIISHNNCERIKTIGDAYLCVCGMPSTDEKHAEKILDSAIMIIKYLNKRNKTSPIEWKIRIGIHTGRVVGGVVGIKKYIYDVFGDTINTASRMESNSEPMKINISESTYSLVKDKYNFIERGTIDVKGKGEMKMFFVTGKKKSDAASASQD